MMRLFPRRLARLCVAVAVASSGVLFSSAPIAARDMVSRQETADAGWIGADLSSGSVVVEVVLAGERVDAILDTGASHTVIDRALADRLGLTTEESVSVGGVSGQVQAREGKGIAVQIGEEIYQADPLIVDLSPTGLEQGVIVGRDFFDAHVVAIDFAGSRIRLLDPEQASALPADPIRLSPTSTRILSFPVSVAGHGMVAELDLGSQLAMTLSPLAADIVAPDKRRSSWIIGDISGFKEVETVSIPELTMAGEALHAVPSIIVDRGDDAVSMRMGLPIIRRFSLVLDLGHRQMWLEPDSNVMGRPFNRDRSGAALEAKSGILKVRHVARASPAAASGLAADDRILKVNGEAVTAENASRLARFGFGEAGTRAALQTADGEVHVLTLSDYY